MTTTKPFTLLLLLSACNFITEGQPAPDPSSSSESGGEDSDDGDDEDPTTLTTSASTTTAGSSGESEATTVDVTTGASTTVTSDAETGGTESGSTGEESGSSSGGDEEEESSSGEPAPYDENHCQDCAPEHRVYDPFYPSCICAPPCRSQADCNSIEVCAGPPHAHRCIMPCQDAGWCATPTAPGLVCGEYLDGLSICQYFQEGP